MLQALIINQYREEVAGKYNIALKPVILFKSRLIKDSEENQQNFHTMLGNLTESKIKNITRSNNAIFQKAFSFFKANNITLSMLIAKLQKSFTENKTINVNEESLDKKTIKAGDKQEVLTQQKILNSLEDKDNEIRAIFAVDKLNEGWDVLNLFDIVRLYETRDSGTGKTGKYTMQEAQLIGRGARYCPFDLKNGEDIYQRKFDKDLNNDLRILEELYYHSKQDSRYIYEIRKALREKGFSDYNETKAQLNLKDNFKKSNIYKKGSIFFNRQEKKEAKSLDSLENLGVKQTNIKISLATTKGDLVEVFTEDKKKKS